MNDSVPEGLISKPQELGWGISLKKEETWEKDYLIEPLKPVAGKEYTLPPAVLYVVFNNRTYNLSTGNFSFILRSSEIIVTKTADKAKVSGPGNVTVNVSVKNNGSRAALVKVRDSLAPDTQIMSGELDFSTILQPGESLNNSYILKFNNISDNISLPYASFEFKEYRSAYDAEKKNQANTGSGISNPVEITFAKAVSAQIQTTPQTTPAQAPSVEETSIEVTPAENLTTGALWINGYKLPYTYLIMLAGVLLVSVVLFMLKVWRLLGLFK